jgi:hypothetical protein
LLGKFKSTQLFALSSSPTTSSISYIPAHRSHPISRRRPLNMSNYASSLEFNPNNRLQASAQTSSSRSEFPKFQTPSSSSSSLSTQFNYTFTNTNMRPNHNSNNNQGFDLYSSNSSLCSSQSSPSGCGSIISSAESTPNGPTGAGEMHINDFSTFSLETGGRGVPLGQQQRRSASFSSPPAKRDAMLKRR